MRSGLYMWTGGQLQPGGTLRAVLLRAGNDKHGVILCHVYEYTCSFTACLD